MKQTLSVPRWKERHWRPSQRGELNQRQSEWLLETGSMTCRCEQFCQSVTVQPQFEGFVAASQLGNEGAELPADDRYWIREIFLFGDTIPWIWARTVVPAKTLDGPLAEVASLGKIPLGRYLFGHAEPERDYIHVSLDDGLWGRRSRFRLSGSPLLLTEIFCQRHRCTDWGRR